MNKNPSSIDPVTNLGVGTQAQAGSTMVAPDDYRAEDLYEPASAATMTDQPDFLLEVGQPVMTIDGQRIGTVKDLSSQHFKVHRTLRSDFWLDDAYIADVNNHAVIVQFAKGDLDSYKLDHPETTDALLNTEEQEIQRAKMEAELAQQNREIAGTRR